MFVGEHFVLRLSRLFGEKVVEERELGSIVDTEQASDGTFVRFAACDEALTEGGGEGENRQEP
jgi:hypothetical protein